MWNEPSTWIAVIASIVFTVATWVFLIGRKSEALTRIENEFTKALEKLEKVVVEYQRSEGSARDSLRNEMNAQIARIEARLETVRSEIYTKIERETQLQIESRHVLRKELLEQDRDYWNQISSRLADFQRQVERLRDK